MMFDQPKLMHQLLDVLARAVSAYLNAQVAAGAQALMLFDTWGGVLTPRDYREFSLRYMVRIIQGLAREHEGRRVPLILFTKNGGQWLETMADSGADARAWGSAWRCRATWTRPYCMLRRNGSAERSKPFSRATAKAAAWCSTWVMASTRMSIPTRWPWSWTRCMT
jgi:uroporphyrinogen-III decarboxylase